MNDIVFYSYCTIFKGVPVRSDRQLPLIKTTKKICICLQGNPELFQGVVIDTDKEKRTFDISISGANLQKRIKEITHAAQPARSDH